MFPSRIFLFIDPTNLSFNVPDVISKFGKYWAIVRSTTVEDRSNVTTRTNSSNDYMYSFESNIYESFKLEEDIILINTSAIDHGIFVIPDINKTSSQRQNQGSYNVDYISRFIPAYQWGHEFIDGSWD